jgi:UDP-glucose 4-epimerase
MTVAWVLGGTGLLGTALSRTMRDTGTALFLPAQRFSWHSESELPQQMATAVRAFALRAGTADGWEIHWAAGTGTMGSAAAALAAETRALALLLELLSTEAGLMARPGSLSFASSAGAIYAGATDDVITENTAPAPTTAYAEVKLRQEDLVRGFVAAHPGTSALIARISTLYGAGQATGKNQGLLGHMARCILRNQPIQIYVPYDTIRDYIDADDAAVAMVGTLRATRSNPQLLTRIIASESPATIAEIVAIFKRLTRRAPRIVRSANRLSSLYSRRVQFRSVVASDYARVPGKRLPVGIAQVMMAERLVFTRGNPATPGPLA